MCDLTNRGAEATPAREFSTAPGGISDWGRLIIGGRPWGAAQPSFFSLIRSW